MIKWLSGKKSYIIAGVSAVVTAAWIMNWIDAAIWMKIMGFLGVGEAFALRAAIQKSIPSKL